LASTLSPAPRLVRVMNVLRGYPAEEIPAAHALLGRPLLEGGLLVEGSADPQGTLATAHLIRKRGDGLWREGLWLSTRFAHGFAPMQLRDWLPRDLRRRVVPGEPIFDFLQAWTSAWEPVRHGVAPHLAFARSVEALASRMEGVCLLRADEGQGACVWRPIAGVPHPLIRR
jgi:hypothetical protein